MSYADTEALEIIYFVSNCYSSLLAVSCIVNHRAVTVGIWLQGNLDILTKS